MPEKNFFYRNFELDRRALDTKNRSIEVVLSTETPIERWMGPEILPHQAGIIDFSRLNSALLNHNPNVIIGRFEGLHLRNKTLVGTLFFDDDEDGNLAMQKVESGSLKGASIGYSVQKFRELRDGETWKGFTGPAYVAEKFFIYEGTLTPIPADSSAGIGRDLSRSLDGIQIVRSGNNDAFEGDIEDMNEQQVRSIIRDEIRAAMAGGSSGGSGQGGEDDFTQAERDIINRASAISQRCTTKVTEMLLQGRSAQECERFIHQSVKADAFDMGGGDGDGAGRRSKTSNGRGTRYTSFQQVQNDDEFCRAFSGSLDIDLD